MALNVITAYTPGYQKHAERLIASGEKHGVTVHAYAYPDQGSWIHGTNIKPSAILRAMSEMDGPVLWLDADAQILKPFPRHVLNALDKYDMAACDALRNRRRAFYVGTLYFSGSPESKWLAGRWESYTRKAKPHHGDEYLLEQARRDLQEEGFSIAYGFLSWRWAWVPGCSWEREQCYVAHELSGEAGKYVQSLTEAQKREVGLE